MEIFGEALDVAFGDFGGGDAAAVGALETIDLVFDAFADAAQDAVGVIEALHVLAEAFVLRALLFAEEFDLDEVCEHLEALGHQEGNVVRLRGSGGELGDGFDYGLDDLGGGQGAVGSEDFDKTLLIEFVVGCIIGFGDAIAVEYQRVAGVQMGVHFAVGSGVENSEDGAAAGEHFGVAVGAHEDGRIVSRIGIGEIAGGGIEYGEEESDEAIARAISASGFVDSRHEMRQIAGIFGQHVDAGLECHHHEGGRHAFSRHIAEGEGDAAIGIGKEIVVVAADGAAGHVETREIGSGNFGAFPGSMPP